MDAERDSGDHSPSTAADSVEGIMPGAYDDACSICLEDFSQSDPSTVTYCKHEFHLHCILEWCQRSSNCPMCWQPISLKDETSSKQLLEAVEHEKSLRACRLRNPTSVYHPTLVNFDLNLPTDGSEVDLEEHIFQQLDVVAAMRSGHHVFRIEGQRSRSSSRRRRSFFILSTPSAPHDASVLSSTNPVRSRTIAVSVGSPSILNSNGSNAQMPFSLSAPQTDEDFVHRVGSNVASADRQRVLSETRSFSNRSSMGNENTAESSDLHSLSESVRSRFSAWSMRYKESISRNTRSWKERLFARSTSMVDLGSEVNSRIAGLSHLLERLDSRLNNGSVHASESSHAGRSIRNDDSDR